MCNDIVVKNDLPLRGSRRNDALDMTPCSTDPDSPIFHVVQLAVSGIMEVNGSSLDVLMKSVLVEQNRTSSIMCHMETICQELVVQIFNGFLQGDDVPLRRNVLFDSSFFSRSWVPIVDAEAFSALSSDWDTPVSKQYSAWDGECFLTGASRNAGFAPLASTTWRFKKVFGSVFAQAEKPSRMDETSSS